MVSNRAQDFYETAGRPQYGRFSTGGKSIKVCSNYGVDVRPTAMTEENMRALEDEEEHSPSSTRSNSPVNTYGMWEYTTLPFSQPSPEGPYSLPPFTSPTPSPSNSSRSSSESESAGQVFESRQYQELEKNLDSNFGVEQIDLVSPESVLEDNNSLISAHATTGGKSITLLQEHNLLNLAQDEKYNLPTSKVQDIPSEITTYINDNPELALAYIKKCLQVGEHHFEISWGTANEQPVLVASSDTESEVGSESDRDFDPASEANFSEQEVEEEKQHLLGGLKDDKNLSLDDFDVANFGSQFRKNFAPSPPHAGHDINLTDSPLVLTVSTATEKDIPVKQHADRRYRKVTVPDLKPAPKKLRLDDERLALQNDTAWAFLLPGEESDEGDYDNDDLDPELSTPIRDIGSKLKSPRVAKKLVPGDYAKSKHRPRIPKLKKRPTRKHVDTRHGFEARPAPSRKLIKAVDWQSVEANAVAENRPSLAKTIPGLQFAPRKTIPGHHPAPRKTVAKPAETSTSPPKRKTTSQTKKANRPAKHSKKSRPLDNSDLEPEFSPDLVKANSIDHTHQLPDQDIRLRMPYPAPRKILSSSWHKYWDELTKANQKVLENPEAKRPNIPWTVWEDDAVIRHMLDIRLDPSVPETEARFREVSHRLLKEHNIYRTETAVKNMWNRVGRARSGFDERKRQSDEMATSLQAGKKRTRVYVDISEDSNSDDDLEFEFRPSKRR